MPITAKELIEAEDAVAEAQNVQAAAWSAINDAKRLVQRAEKAYEEARYQAELAKEELQELKKRIRTEGE